MPFAHGSSTISATGVIPTPTPFAGTSKTSAVIVLTYVGVHCPGDVITWAISGTATNINHHESSDGINCTIFAMGSSNGGAAYVNGSGQTIIATPTINGVAQSALTFIF